MKRMTRIRLTVIAFLAIGGLMAANAISADESKPATPAERKAEAAPSDKMKAEAGSAGHAKDNGLLVFAEKVKCSETPKAGDIWVSQAGDDANPGTKESPLKELETAVSKASAGKTIWLMPGTYQFKKSVIIEGKRKIGINGTAAEPIGLSGVLDGPRPVLDFATATGSAQGIRMRANYWHFRYFEVKNANDTGIHLSGSNNVLERLDVHDCGDTGIQLSKWSRFRPADNLILNCDSYMNADNKAENADGFGAKLIIGPGNVFKGCRAWNNVDDGWDFYDARNVVVLEDCWSIQSKHPTKSKSNSDGNGFKLGGQRRLAWYEGIDAENEIRKEFPTYEDYVAVNTLAHKLTNCFAIHNPSTGFDRNNNKSTKITCTDCGAWGNGLDVEDGIRMLGKRVDLPSVTPEKAIAAKRDSKGYLPDIRTLK